MVLEHITAKGYVILDPGRGRCIIGEQEFEKAFTGMALAICPSDSFEPKKRRRFGMVAFLLPFIPRKKAPFFGFFLASLLLACIALVPPYLSKFLVNTMPSGGSKQLLALLAGLVIVFGLCNLATSMGRAEVLLRLQTVIDSQLMRTFFGHLLKLPYQYFQTRRGGDIMVRAGSATYMRDILSGRMLAVLVDVVLMGVYLFAVGSVNVLALILLVVVIVVELAIIVSTLPLAKQYSQNELLSMGDAQSTLLETIGGIESVKTSSAEQESYRRWLKAFRIQLGSSVKRRRLDGLIGAALSSIQLAAPLLFALCGAWFVLRGQISVGDMVALSALSGAALSPIATFGQSLQALQTVGVHLNRIKDVLDEPEEERREDGLELALAGEIHLRDVSFSYGDSSPEVLREVSFRIMPGSKVAIVGASASGKSTLARVLIGLLKPRSGQIFFDGHDLSEVNVTSLRSQCGVVTQAPDLFSGSIEQNIIITRPDAEEVDVWQALELAGLSLEIKRMPLGLATPLGEAGVGLSGGQMQRLAIARALINRPRLLVLDEATSHLDASLETKVFHNLATIGCTQVIVAHRLSTVRDADQIIVLQEGSVVGMGTHEHLMRSCGEYRFLVKRQLPQPT